jgi:uncharacterized membrane protein (UPF0127 family)
MGIVRALFGFVMVLGLALSTPTLAATAPLPQSSLVIETASGPKTFAVEVAENDETRERGMMFRTAIAPDHGMLFYFQTPQVVSFWMKNCLISLDMIFIRKDGVIANIRADAKPGDLTPLWSDGPILGVLEVAGGLSAKLGLKAGDKVRHPYFQ